MEATKVVGCPRTRISKFKKAGIPISPELIEEQRLYDKENKRKHRNKQKTTPLITFTYVIVIQPWQTLC